MNVVNTVPFNQIDPKVWNKFVDESPEAWLYHRTEWMEIEEVEGYQNESFMVLSDEGSPLGIFCVYLSSRGPWWRLWERYFHTGHCRGGPAMVGGLSAKHREEVFISALDYLKKRAQIYRSDRLEVRLPSLAPAYLPPMRGEINPLGEYGFRAFPMYGRSGVGRLRGNITPTTIVELHGNDEETLFSALSPMCRKAVRKATRAGVTCMEGNGSRDLELFYALYESSYLRSASERRPFTFFCRMSENLAEKGWMKVFLAHHEEKPIASILLLSYKDALTYYAGGVDYDAQLLRPHQLLFWETLRWARQNGWRWYEMGPYFPYLPKDNKMARIGFFKRQFGGREFSLFEGVFFYNWPMYCWGALLEETRLRIYACLHRLRSAD